MTARSRRVEKRCKNCRKVFHPRAADVARGWGQFCDKSCKATHQERRTGQHAAFQHRRAAAQDSDGGVEYESAGWDAHKEWTFP